MGMIWYCPQCGELYHEDIILVDEYCRECNSGNPFSKKHKNAKLIKTDIGINKWPRKKGEPIDAFGFTPTRYQNMWNHYIDIPENDKLDRALFEACKKKKLDFFAEGGWNGIIIDNRQSQQPKDASVIGRGVAGAIIAGPAGAVIGAASALDKNMKNANKKK